MARTASKAFKIDLRPIIRDLGLRHVIEQVGLDKVIEEIGVDRLAENYGTELVKKIGVDRFLTGLTPAQRRELKRRLQES